MDREDFDTLESIMGKEAYAKLAKVRPGPADTHSEAEKVELNKRKKLYQQKPKFDIISLSTAEINLVKWNE